MSRRTEHPVSASRFEDRTPAAAVIRPAGPADMAALGDFFAALSTQARYLRFFAPVTPAPALLRVLSGGRASVDAIVAVRDGVIIGHAMAADQPATGGPWRPRTVQGPPAPAVTDIGVVVADAWQGRGVGSALVSALVIRAQARGVTSMTMDVLHANHRALSMIERRWPAADIARFGESAAVHVRLPRPQQLPSPSPDARTCAGGGERTYVPVLAWLTHRSPHRSRRRLDNPAHNRPARENHQKTFGTYNASGPS